MQQAQLLDDNLNKTTHSFYKELKDNCRLDKEKFNDLTKSVLDLHKSDLTLEQRMSVAIKLWELSFLISGLLSNHFDKNDVYKIKNLKSDDTRQIHNILYYLCNWFSYVKEIDERNLVFGSW